MQVLKNEEQNGEEHRTVGLNMVVEWSSKYVFKRVFKNRVLIVREWKF